MKFIIEVHPTHIIVSDADECINILEPLLDKYQYEDEYIESINILGFYIDEKTNTLYLNKGVSVDYLVHMLKTQCEVKLLSGGNPCKPMNFEYEEIVPPRDDIQTEIIDFIAGTGIWNDIIDVNQIFVVAATGLGKTYCSCVGSCVYKTKTLVICGSIDILKQWRNSYIEKTGMCDADIHSLDTSDLMTAIDNELDLGEVYLLSHATFLHAFGRMGESFEMMNKAISNLGIGLKIIDEAHLNFANTLKIDFAMNVRRNLYLTATDGRSNRDEDAIFKSVFSKATYFKKSENHTRKWVEYNAIFLNTHCLPARYRYQVAGGRGMSPVKYGKYVIDKDKKKMHYKCIIEIIRDCFKNDNHSKILVFLPLIDECNELRYMMNMTLGRDKYFEYDLNITTINSHNSKKENDRARAGDVIITTIQSCGTGTDIPGTTDIICCSPFKSTITTKQVLGRLRYCGKICHYYDIIDESVPMDIIFAKLRLKTFRRYCLSTNSMQWEEE